MNKRRIYLISAFFVTLSSFTPQTVKASFTDINNHWASTQITKWVDSGMVNGYSDRTFKPDSSITRAEFIAMVNRVFNYTDIAAIGFSDVSENDWFTIDIKKAVNAGYISGYEDGTMQPDSPVTRQEAAKILSISFSLDTESTTTNMNFTDSSSIDKWAAKYVGVLAGSGILKGDENGRFAPQSFLTRAEAITMLDRLSGNVLNQPNSTIEAKHYTSNLLVNKPDIKLKNTVIEGNLYLTEGINSGGLDLENVTVSGKVYVMGCSADKINFTKCSFGQLFLNSADSAIPIIANGLTANLVSIQSPASINVLSDSKINIFSINTCSKVLISDISDVKRVNISEKAEKSVIYAKPGISVNSASDSITVNNKQVGKGTFLTEAYNLDIIDIK